jgi:tRNA(Ile)-lysidine synthase
MQAYMSSHLLHWLEQSLTPHVSPDVKVVVALSGGVDSRVLLDLISAFKKKKDTPLAQVEAVHVHHGLSPYADNWVASCQQWCLEAGINLSIERVSLSLERGESIEHIAREARYEALASHLSEGDILLTGQHSDDQLETFLLALKRGSGPKGLSAMAEVMPFRQATLIRPLLKVTRESILSYARESNIDWVEDESNQDTRFDRNFIRHQVAPVLTQRWPSFHVSVQRSAELCAQQEQLLDELLYDKLHRVLQDDLSVSILGLSEVSDIARSHLLRMWLAQLNVSMPSQVQLNHLWYQIALAKPDANPKLRLNHIEIRRFDGRLFCVPITQDVSQWHCRIDIKQAVNLPDGLGILRLLPIAPDSESQYTLSYAPLTGKLSVCFNPEKLTACPYGKLGSKTLKKWFQEYAIPSWQRRRMPILMCDEKVVAVANLFIDRQFYGKDCELIWDR